VAVADHGSVVAAAHHLFVSPGGVSQAISALESTLKVQLVVRRRSKGATLTPAGASAVERARDILEQVAELEATTRSERNEVVGHLRLGCFITLGPWMVPRIAEHFASEHPAVRLSVSETPADELLNQVASGALDAAIMLSWQLGPGVQSTPVAPIRVRLLLHPEHRLASNEAVRLTDLGDEPLALLSLQPTRQRVLDAFERAGHHANVRWESPNPATIRGLVARGLAYGVIMGRPAGDATYDGLPLVYREIADDLEPNSVVLVTPEGSRPSGRVRALTEFCQSAFGRHGLPVQ
jgi:DNA-binding transcriptional LysR family regulator